MGSRAGIHSGQVHGRTVTADGKYPQNSQWISANQFQTTYISGTAASVSSVTLMDYDYAFDDGVVNYVGFSFVVPTNIKADTKANVIVYWTSSGVAANDDGAVFDVDYWNYSQYVSGSAVVGLTYVMSGISGQTKLGNATVTGIHGIISGCLNQSTLVIPAVDIKAGEYVRCLFFRDAGETADDLDAPAHVLGLLLEFVD